MGHALAQRNYQKRVERGNQDAPLRGKHPPMMRVLAKSGRYLFQPLYVTQDRVAAKLSPPIPGQMQNYGYAIQRSSQDIIVSNNAIAQLHSK